jgi:hypothetical protein
LAARRRHPHHEIKIKQACGWVCVANERDPMPAAMFLATTVVHDQQATPSSSTFDSNENNEKNEKNGRTTTIKANIYIEERHPSIHPSIISPSSSSKHTDTHLQ